MSLEKDVVRENIRQAATEDLLDRATVYRQEMEPVALRWIDAELAERGIDGEDIAQHRATRAEAIRHAGVTQRCTFCDRPAVFEQQGWHRLWDRIPLFPRWLRYCLDHHPDGPDTEREPDFATDE